MGELPRSFLSVVAVALLLLAPPALLPADEPTTLDDSSRADVIAALAERVAASYVDPALAGELADGLRAELAAGAWDGVAEPRELASSLTVRLQPHDRHFLVSWAPPGSGAGILGGHGEEEMARWREYSRGQNFGFRRVEVLAGNVGYLDLRFFDDPDHAAGVAEAALALLARADAVIVDLTRNGGGEPGMVQLLASYFLGPEPVHFNSLFWREAERERQFWTLPAVRGERLLEPPLYVLVSARTGSAAEELAYGLQARGRATVVGRRSAGAANPGEGFALPHGFSVFVSTGRAVNPVTGGNWEGSGVLPDVDVAREEALAVAWEAALRGLLPEARGETERRQVAWALEALEVERAPVALPAALLSEYAGTYGDRRIRRDGDRLTYQRGRRSIVPMIPLGDDRFLLAGVDGFRTGFQRDASGAVVRLVDRWADGHVEVGRRVD